MTRMSNWCHFTYVEHSCYDSTQRLSIHINPFYAAIHTSHPYSKIPKIRDTRDPRAQMLLTGYMFHDPGALCFPNHCSLFIVHCSSRGSDWVKTVNAVDLGNTEVQAVNISNQGGRAKKTMPNKWPLLTSETNLQASWYWHMNMRTPNSTQWSWSV